MWTVNSSDQNLIHLIKAFLNIPINVKEGLYERIRTKLTETAKSAREFRFCHLNKYLPHTHTHTHQIKFTLCRQGHSGRNTDYTVLIGWVWLCGLEAQSSSAGAEIPFRISFNPQPPRHFELLLLKSVLCYITMLNDLLLYSHITNYTYLHHFIYI